jgi:hypothetical protein
MDPFTLLRRKLARRLALAVLAGAVVRTPMTVQAEHDGT